MCDSVASATGSQFHPRQRPTQEQLHELVEEFALNSYRMMAGRNIETAMVKLHPSMEPPYFSTLMSPLEDFFPSALVVLSHAMLESVVRNVQKLLHAKRTAEDLDLRWSASDLQMKIYGELERCGVELVWSDQASRRAVEAAGIALIARRHRIAHRADLPQTAASSLDLASNVIVWSAAAVVLAAGILKSAFPELHQPANVDLLAKIDRVCVDWHEFATQVDVPRPSIGITV